ncbi:MAG TPA: Uma2 family endonuclease [Ktedonobacterales bacterium]
MAAPQPAWGDVYEMPDTITADDLLRLPDDGAKNELYEGVLVREFASPGHGDICHRLGGMLGVYALASGFPNRIVQNALFDLTPPGAARKTVLAPDVALMRSSAAPSWNVPQDVPLLAIEVVSESQTVAELALKGQFYRSAGTDEVWIVDHKTRAIEIWDANGTHTLDDTRTLTTPLLPGFSLSVRALLDG